MRETISWSIDVSVVNGPSVKESAKLNVGAYDVITLALPGADSGSGTPVTATIQPSAAADVQLLLIRASPYGAGLTFTVQGAGGATDVPVDQPQLYLGQGATALGGTAPLTLDFTNELGAGNDATVTILVGRDAS